MKKLLSMNLLLMYSIFSFADNEKLCVVKANGALACTATQLGIVEPCSQQLFKLDYKVPDGFVILSKIEWFVNGVSVKISTSANDPALLWQIKAPTTEVSCKVNYRTLDGARTSDPFAATSFIPNVKQINFANDGITPTSPPPNLGCNTTVVSYSLNPYNCTGQYCDVIYPVTQYSITWQAPTGWTQTSISTNGNNVSLLADASSQGLLTATITLPCGYKETRTYSITRSALKPTFQLGNTVICTSPSNISINAVCGALNYTYTIEGPSGIVFASTGQQSITTNSSNPTLNLAGDYTPFVVKVKANYTGNVVSEEESIQLLFGTPKLLFITGNEAFNLTSQRFDYGVNGPGNSFSVCPGENLTFTPYVPSGFPQGSITGHEWALSGSYSFPSALSQNSLSVTAGSIYPSSFQFTYRYQNQCGWSPLHYGQASTMDCDGGAQPFGIGGGIEFTMSPNPTKSDVAISLKGISTKFEVRVFEMNTSTLVKLYRYDKALSQIKLPIFGLKAGTYIVQITSNGIAKTKQLKVVE
jgi:hypothetical protein